MSERNALTRLIAALLDNVRACLDIYSSSMAEGKPDMRSSSERAGFEDDKRQVSLALYARVITTFSGKQDNVDF